MIFKVYEFYPKERDIIVRYWKGYNNELKLIPIALYIIANIEKVELYL